ncbi:hypothetical protein K450DRAFT_220848 [Umbelopsis ramanniana AG]|uniref:Transmembrane protein n=1 Tax=Umbelopsis ramanniana AG TaxID=1314678 RepID=A0AAD5EIQ5_UMBRA|nr:uncharacterized protein K450DRAFT_220848 [Umbelopsis ramanniana AG]KAI8583969.1 hypothetical protein K450DRAFT_220848 [Umbelopsis ramanniana AG]
MLSVRNRQHGSSFDVEIACSFALVFTYIYFTLFFRNTTHSQSNKKKEKQNKTKKITIIKVLGFEILNCSVHNLFVKLPLLITAMFNIQGHDKGDLAGSIQHD